MDCSMPGFPAHHQLPELAQTHVHRVVMPSSHLILCRPLLLPSIFPSIRVFPQSLFASSDQSIGASASIQNTVHAFNWAALSLVSLFPHLHTHLPFVAYKIWYAYEVQVCALNTLKKCIVTVSFLLYFLRPPQLNSLNFSSLVCYWTQTWTFF